MCDMIARIQDHYYYDDADDDDDEYSLGGNVDLASLATSSNSKRLVWFIPGPGAQIFIRRARYLCVNNFQAAMEDSPVQNNVYFGLY